MLNKLKSIQIPHVFVLLTAVVFMSSVSSYFIPSGSYMRETKQIGSIQRTLVIPGTYEQIDKHYSFKAAILGEDNESKATPVLSEVRPEQLLRQKEAVNRYIRKYVKSWVVIASLVT